MVKLLIVGLSGDSGCQIAALGLHEALLDILMENDLVYAPTLIDVKDVPEGVDVALIEGGIRIKHEEVLTKEIRKKSKVVISIGSCACFGGIPGLANLEQGEELMKMVYSELEGTVGGEIPHHDVIEPYMRAIESAVKVDYTIPGCPPEVEDIAYVVTTLLKGETPVLSKTDVCDDCPRERQQVYSSTLKRLHEEVPDPERCLLELGFICMGPATRGGCGAPCPSAGSTCDGCRGPTEKTDDQGLTMLDALMSLIGAASENFSLPRHSGLIYRYTFANSRVSKLLSKRKSK